MLPAGARLRRRRDFSVAVRRGARAATATLVVHLAPTDAADGPLVGFAVGRTVGPAVVRNRVRRRLRHLAREVVPALPPGSRLVVRALPPAAQAGYRDLGTDLQSGVRRATARAARAAGRGLLR